VWNRRQQQRQTNKKNHYHHVTFLPWLKESARLLHKLRSRRNRCPDPGQLCAVRGHAVSECPAFTGRRSGQSAQRAHLLDSCPPPKDYQHDAPRYLHLYVNLCARREWLAHLTLLSLARNSRQNRHRRQARCPFGFAPSALPGYVRLHWPFFILIHDLLDSKTLLFNSEGLNHAPSRVRTHQKDVCVSADLSVITLPVATRTFVSGTAQATSSSARTGAMVRAPPES
jgi:hypothetical protein